MLVSSSDTTISNPPFTYLAERCNTVRNGGSAAVDEIEKETEQDVSESEQKSASLEKGYAAAATAAAPALPNNRMTI